MSIGGPLGIGIGVAAVAAVICIYLHRTMAPSAHRPRGSRGRCSNCRKGAGTSLKATPPRARPEMRMRLTTGRHGPGLCVVRVVRLKVLIAFSKFVLQRY